MSVKCKTCDRYLTVESGTECIFCLVAETNYPPPDYRKIEEGKTDEHPLLYRPSLLRL